jgi:hypothetical protein
MDRRDFLKAAVAVPVAATLPAAIEAKPLLDAAKIKAAVSALFPDQDWYVVLHPSQERDLRDLEARDRWHGAHLEWRKAGKPEMTCRAVLEKYRPRAEWEAGRFDGYKFIESEWVS